MRGDDVIGKAAEAMNAIWALIKARRAKGEPTGDLEAELDPDDLAWFEGEDVKWERMARSEDARRLAREIEARKPKPPPPEREQPRRHLQVVPDEPEPEPEPQPMQAADVIMDDDVPPAIPSGRLEFEDGSSRPVDDDDRRRGVGWRP